MLFGLMAAHPTLPFAGLALFAVEPTWTDKEVLDAILKVIGILATVVAVAIPLCTTWARRRARTLQKERDKVVKDNTKLANTLALKELHLEKMSDQLTRLEQEARLLESEKGVRSFEADEQHRDLEKLTGHLAAARQEADVARGDLEGERRRVEKAMERDGQTWTEKVLSNAPKFKPLEPDGRRTPIISVLNLKGGVGKTTITANLGAALDRLGYRVLLIDLDLQGSLTGLFLSDSSQEQQHHENRMIGDFFFASYDKDVPNLLDFVRPILPDGKSGLVGTSDALAYAETNLMIRWILRDAKADPRFLLRRELHLKRITGKFDIILLDCPPLLSISCVNALAASDYLLIPVMPSKQVTSRVPVLLEYFKKIRDNLSPDLNALGIVANRTFRAALTKEELTRFASVRDQCKDILKQPVVCFDTNIQQCKSIRDAEDGHRPLNVEDDAFQSFTKLAQEVTEHLPAFCLSKPPTGAVAKETVL